MIDYMKKSSDHGENVDKFIYSYLDKKITNQTFSKIFEIRGDSEHFYIFSQNNKK